ncbi:MAG: DUF58 domain-containing protein [Dehalococcoidia bacterium]|jgi:uncharacterized protein (DUF58 family)|nr:DUF58 domain-containing protein [Dehalococcoidia bacterium]
MAATVHAIPIELHDRPADLAGHVFGRITTIALVVLIGVAAWFRQPAVVTLLGLTLATVGVSRAWSRLSLRRVRCERTFSATALFPGDELLITTRLSNQKPLPLPWVEVAQQLPPRLLGREAGDDAEGGTLARSLSMPWYSRLTWKETLTPRSRGYYFVPPLTVTSGDILGLYPRVMEAGKGQDVAVYPRLYPVRRLPLQRADATGELTGRLSLNEDPTRMRGIRDYQPQDGMRRVHWKASARHGDIKVRLYEPSALSRVTLVLCADGFGEFTDGEPFELAASTIASVGCYCVEHQMQMGFLSNARLVAGSGQARLSPGSGNAQLTALLELLARATPSPDAPFERLADELRRLASSGSGLIAVVGRMSAAYVDTFAHLAARKSPLLVLVVEDSGGHQSLPFACRQLTGPDGLLDMGGA